MPFLNTLKLLFLELICVVDSAKPPIVPPVNDTADPVKSPFSFTLKLELEINLRAFASWREILFPAKNGRGEEQ